MFKRVRVSSAATGVLCAAVLAFGAIASAQNGLPRLVDREIFFGNPEIAGAQISPDGQYVAFDGNTTSGKWSLREKTNGNEVATGGWTVTRK